MNVFTVSTFLLICIQFSLTYHLFSDCSHFATKRGLFQEQVRDFECFIELLVQRKFALAVFRYMVHSRN